MKTAFNDKVDHGAYPRVSRLPKLSLVLENSRENCVTQAIFVKMLYSEKLAKEAV